MLPGLLQLPLSRRPFTCGVRSASGLGLQKHTHPCSEMADPAKYRMRTALRLGGFLGFVGGFLLAYQRSSRKQIIPIVRPSLHLLCVSVRFWGWSENKREEQMDFEELSLRVKEGKPLYGDSHQPAWVQGSAHRNSAYSQLKFCTSPPPPQAITLC